MPKYNDFDLDLQEATSPNPSITGPIKSGRPSCDPVPQCVYTVYVKLCE